MYPIDGFVPKVMFEKNYDAQTAMAVVPEPIVTQKQTYDPRRVLLQGGDTVHQDSAATRKPVFVNPYTTPDQVIAPAGIENARNPSQSDDDKGDTGENHRRPAKNYDVKKLDLDQVNNRHSSLKNRQEKFRNSPFNQAFRKALSGLNSTTISPTNNPTRKQFNRAYTPPLQAFRVIPLWDSAAARQTPVGRREMQPSIIIPGPQSGIDTAMPWNAGSSGRYTPIGN